MPDHPLFRLEDELRLTGERVGKYESLRFGTNFSTALDSQGVLHAAFYDTTNGDLMYATRDTEGLWSAPRVIVSRFLPS